MKVFAVFAEDGSIPVDPFCTEDPPVLCVYTSKEEADLSASAYNKALLKKYKVFKCFLGIDDDSPSLLPENK